MTSPLTELLRASKTAAAQLERIGTRAGCAPEENRVLVELKAAIEAMEAPAEKPTFLVLNGGLKSIDRRPT